MDFVFAGRPAKALEVPNGALKVTDVARFQDADSLQRTAFIGEAAEGAFEKRGEILFRVELFSK
jgi:hypothetical protein